METPVPNPMIGRVLSHYRILDKIGEGGMGVLYRAIDTHLDRVVALKLLHEDCITRADLRHRLLLEAKAASALNHPNIVTIYDIDRADGIDFIAMEFVEGQPLAQMIPSGGLPIGEALAIACQISAAFAAAHAGGIVHRDVKPGNIMVIPSGHVKILDFGLAKLTSTFSLNPSASTMTALPSTQEGAVVGTFAYMSPEQAEGQEVDTRSDVFAFGTVLYEMFTGVNPFRSDTGLSTLAAVLAKTPEPLRKLRPDAPPECESIAKACLQKNPESRPVLSDVSAKLAACEVARTALALRSILRNPLLTALVLLLFLIPSGWLGLRYWRLRWVRGTALPEIARLVEKQQFLAAHQLVKQAEQYAPDDPHLARFLNDAIRKVSIRTSPLGAEFIVRDYESAAQGAEWTLLGKTPLDNVEIPLGFYHYKIRLPGYAEAEGAFSAAISSLTFTLQPAGSAPAGMVFVSAGNLTFPTTSPARIKAFWLDKYEVTNRRFKEFADAGGYRNPRFWKHPFVNNGRTLSFEQAMAGFRDSTGRTGPATWELGTYVDGRADYPVAGVSWFEAAAYAEFAGKALPTVYHWMHAAGLAGSSGSAIRSNFLSKGPGRAGEYEGMSPYGNYDMAGNVKEWVWNQAGERRYSLGGSWSDSSYMFLVPDALQPFERQANQGFRCARFSDPVDDLLLGPVVFVTRDRRGEKPAGDELFQTLRNMHAYDKTDLKATSEIINDGSPHWRREKITFQAPYGVERVTAHLFLPKNSSPPFQTVMYFPGAGSILTPGANLELDRIEFIVRSGRAVLYPVYKGMYERGPAAYYHRLGKPNLWREMNIQWSMDLGRSIDYLETRSEIDKTKLAFFGASLGAAQAPRLVALEPRIKTAILLQGGFFERVAAEVDPLHFAPRVRVPVLMINGRDDFLFPLEGSQLPLFNTLGTADTAKKHILYNGGHTIFDIQVIREVLDWLDRYLGPIATTSTTSQSTLPAR